MNTTPITHRSEPPRHSAVPFSQPNGPTPLYSPQEPTVHTTSIPFAKYLITACLAVMSLQPASAAIFYNGRTTVDTQTGYRWLALNETTGLSYNQVSAQLGAGGEFEGFRYASQREVLSFMAHAGVIANGTPVQDGHFATLGLKAAADFQFSFRYTSLDGASNPPYTIYHSRGFTLHDEDSFANPGVVDLIGSFRSVPEVEAHYDGLLQLDGGFAVDTASSTTSSWLVQSVSAVPEPATVANMAFGLSLLSTGMWLQRRRVHSGAA